MRIIRINAPVTFSTLFSSSSSSYSSDFFPLDFHSLTNARVRVYNTHFTRLLTSLAPLPSLLSFCYRWLNWSVSFYSIVVAIRARLDLLYVFTHKQIDFLWWRWHLLLTPSSPAQLFPSVLLLLPKCIALRCTNNKLIEKETRSQCVCVCVFVCATAIFTVFILFISPSYSMSVFILHFMYFRSFNLLHKNRCQFFPSSSSFCCILALSCYLGEAENSFLCLRRPECVQYDWNQPPSSNDLWHFLHFPASINSLHRFKFSRSLSLVHLNEFLLLS